jgi:heme/copper-type cytochrome/quinol oxidase subunit 1
MLNEKLGKAHFWITFLGFSFTFFPMHLVGAGGMMRRIYDPTQYAHLRHLQPLNVFMTEGAMILGIGQIILAMNFFFSLFRVRAAAMRWLAVVVSSLCYLSFAPIIDLVISGLGVKQSPMTLLNVTFESPLVSLPAGIALAAIVLIFLTRKRLSFGDEAGNNPWQANTLEWQTTSPPPHHNYDHIPLVFHGPYEYSSPHDVEGDFLPQNSPVDAAPHIAEMGDAHSA